MLLKVGMLINCSINAHATAGFLFFRLSGPDDPNSRTLYRG